MAKAKRTEAPTKGLFYDPARRGYAAVYRENELNHCPGCGRTHWHIGRTTAECAFCTTALPLASATSQGMRGLFRTHRPIAA
jgi:hypothetical protein